MKTIARASRPLVTLASLLLLAAPVRGGDAPAPQTQPQQTQPQQGQPPQAPGTTPPQGGAGGDGGARPKAASMVIEESSAAEPEPPAPVGEERQNIGEYIKSHGEDVRECYSKRLVDRPTLQGKLVARFHIGPSGKVIGVTAEGIGDTALVACVVGVVRKWEFEKPTSGGKLRVVYPWLLKPEATR